METQLQTAGNYEAARHYAALGYKAIPIASGQKAPPLVKWKRYQTEAPTLDDYRAWFADATRNIALLTGEIVVADVDDPALLNLVTEKCGETSVISKTPSGGFHLWYRKRRGPHIGNRVDVKGKELDLRAEGGYAVVPPSRTRAGAYQWLGVGLPAISDLPFFRVSWTRERVRRVIRPIDLIDGSDRMVRRARAYLATIEGAISGQRGHDRTFRVACKLTHEQPRGFGLSLQEAWPLFKEWNEQCEPPWSDRELLHKLEDALKKRT